MTVPDTSFSEDVIYLPLGGTLLGGGLEIYSIPPPDSKDKDSLEKTEAKPRRRNEIWDTCVSVLDYEPRTKVEKGLWGKVVSSLKSADATPDQIESAAKEYRRRWPAIDLTITALEKWFSHCLRTAETRIPKPPCPRCGIGGDLHSDDCPALK